MSTKLTSRVDSYFAIMSPDRCARSGCVLVKKCRYSDRHTAKKTDRYETASVDLPAFISLGF